jgi:hypothetical protein
LSFIADSALHFKRNLTETAFFFILSVARTGCELQGRSIANTVMRPSSSSTREPQKTQLFAVRRLKKTMILSHFVVAGNQI